MKKANFILPGIILAATLSGARSVPIFRPVDLRDGEKPVEVKSETKLVASNGLFDRMRVTVVFTNPNRRDFSGDFELALPEGAVVCGYALEIDGVMEKGVVVAKEKARVAFESEKARRADPGLVEHAGGDIWRTRIFPLRCNRARKAEVDYIVQKEVPECKSVCERNGDEFFIARHIENTDGRGELERVINAFDSGVVVWDASGSAKREKDLWRKRVLALPSKGSWLLVRLGNAATILNGGKRFSSRDELLKAIDAMVYDGGSDIASAIDLAATQLNDGERILFFSDELDTMGIDAPRYEENPRVIIAGRVESKNQTVQVKKISGDDPAAKDAKDGGLLAIAWAAERIRALSAQADLRSDEFLRLGRRYGVASPVTSIIVLETLDQWVTHKIEPPKDHRFHQEWVKLRASEDDEISKRKAQAEHEKDLLALWEERIKWWKNPIPPVKKPQSGLFGRVFAAATGRSPQRQTRMSMRSVEYSAAEPVDGAVMAHEAVMACKNKKVKNSDSRAKRENATISLSPWNPKSEYLKELEAVKLENAYDKYLVLKETHGLAPAFYMDVADWFFKKSKNQLAKRILSNMAEFGLDNAAIWRSMGWRLREAGEYDEAVRCMRKALQLRNEEGQSRRDLALVLTERGKRQKSAADISEAMKLLKAAAFTVWPRRSGRRSNDRQVSIVALEELNALIAYSKRLNWPSGNMPVVPSLDSVFRRDMPVKIRIVMSWSADETDIDIHVLEPDGEEAFYRNRRTGSGGFVSEDVTSGYGPEEYLRKEGNGVFKVLCNYFASAQTSLTGPTTVTVTVYTDWATEQEQMKILTLRLDKPKDKHLIGSVEIK